MGLPTGAVLNCADNSGAKSLYVIEAYGTGSHLNRLPDAGVGDMVVASVKKGKPELRKKSEWYFDSECPSHGVLEGRMSMAKRWMPTVPGLQMRRNRLRSGDTNACFQPCPRLLSVKGRRGVGETACSFTSRCVHFIHLRRFYCIENLTLGQRWRYREPQGRDEGLCHHWPCRKRMRE